jgi:hypothetical protein
MQVNTEFYEYLTQEKIDQIIETLTQKSQEDKPENSKWTEKFL